MVTLTCALVHGQSTLPFLCHLNEPRYGKQSFQLLSYPMPTCATALNLGEKNLFPVAQVNLVVQSTFPSSAMAPPRWKLQSIATLLSWCPGAGVWPSKGFRNEEFSPKSLRGQNSSQPLARGWRPGHPIISFSLFGVNHIMVAVGVWQDRIFQ